MRVVEQICRLWIEHEANWNDRVTSRDQLNMFAEAVLGPAECERIREQRAACRAADAERGRR